MRRLMLVLLLVVPVLAFAQERRWERDREGWKNYGHAEQCIGGSQCHV